MKEYVIQITKFLLTKIGILIPNKVVYRLQTIVYYFRLAKWMQKKNFITKKRMLNRELVFKEVALKFQTKKFYTSNLVFIKGIACDIGPKH